MREARYVRGLDGLRALAVILVFLSHKAHVQAVDIGRLGVWTFFLISGFLIVGELHRSRLAVERGTTGRRRALRVFLGKRARRILPVYYLLLAALAIAHATVYQRGVDLGLAWHAAFLSNLWIGVIRNGWPGSTSHFWSLAVEQQFYLIAPVVLLATRASRHLACCAASVALAAFGHLLLVREGASPVLIYAFSPWNFALIALGGIGGIARSRGIAPGPRVAAALSWGGAAGVAFCLTLPRLMPGGAGGLTDLGLAVALGCLLFWLVNRPDALLATLLERAPLAYLGTISYGFYLFHNLVPAHFGALPGLYHRLHLPPMLQILLADLLQFLLAALCAHLSWRYLERRLLARRKPLETGLRDELAAGSQAPPR